MREEENHFSSDSRFHQGCPFCGDDYLFDYISPHKHCIATFMPDFDGAYYAECLKCGYVISDITEDGLYKKLKHAYDTREYPNKKIKTAEEIE